jgi:three-Cys-motif partner protein
MSEPTSPVAPEAASGAVPGDAGGFFSESSEQSRVKARIVAEFFFVWARIISPTAERTGDRIAYIDLFAGPGRYDDGTRSTPLLILRQAIADPKMRRMLVALLNDAAPAHSARLEAAIKALPDIETLRYPPKIYNWEVGPETVKLFESKGLVPTFTFLDPWGYKGLSLPLIRGLVKDWGSDCMFFFNYNRINMGLTNEGIEPHLTAIFGEQRLAELREQVEGAAPATRENALLQALARGLGDLGGQYVTPFRFRRDDGRVSHYLIGVTKDFKGYEVMKDIMAKHSTSEIDGVASFEYDPRRPGEQPEFLFASPIDELGEKLREQYAGQKLTVRQIFERHSPREPRCVLRNYQEALRRLEGASQIQMDPPAEKRRKRNGVPTVAEHVTVIFLPTKRPAR